MGLGPDKSMRRGIGTSLSKQIVMNLSSADLIIEPPKRWAFIHLRDVWDFRHLLFRLAARDITLRYRQTALGVIWVILQPLLAAGVFSFVFGKIADLPSEGVPYFAFSYAGMLGWNLFSSTLSKFSTSLLANSGLVSKVFFPRLILPLSTLGSTFTDFAVALAMMTVILAATGVGSGIRLMILPFWVLLALMIGAGIGLVSAALMVNYRDVGYVIPIMLQILMYATPIAYSLTEVPKATLVWVELNPLTGVMLGFRWSLLGVSPPDTFSITCSAIAAPLLFLAGMVSFSRMERRFADVI